MRKIVVILLLVLFFSPSCRKKQQNNEYKKLVDTLQVNTIDTELTKGLQMEKKPVVIDGPSVIFFMPDYKERMQIIRFYGAYNQYDFEHIFSNFRRLALDARQALAKHKIKSFLTYSWQFDIKTDSGYVHFDRKAQNEIIGFIIADGHRQPLIKFGLYKYVEFEKLIKDYFEILDFKMSSEPGNYKVQPVPQGDGSP